MASPVAESSNVNGKRPVAASSQTRKKQKKDDEAVDQSPGADKEPAGKVKPTRGSRSVVAGLLLTYFFVNHMAEHARFVVA